MDLTIFKKTVREDAVTGGRIHLYEHPCGLTINIIPKTGFSKIFAGIAIPFGSIHNDFEVNGARVSLPAGTAHYMEHCVFSKDEDGGLLSKMSSMGASANAYTSNTHTLYYFSCVSNFLDILKIYMNAVLDPYLGTDRVEAEREIIIQELDMYKDDPDSRVYNELMKAMYLYHSVREDIGGSEESVRQITSSHLQIVSQRFYTPSSMMLTVVGNVDERQILELTNSFIDKGATEGRPVETNYYFEDEPERVGQDNIETIMDVTVESFLLGYKDRNVNATTRLQGTEKMRIHRGGQLFWEMLLGKSSIIYETLFSQGLINDSFGYHFVCESTYSYFVIGGESPDPEKACAELKRLITAFFHSSPDESVANEFDIQKKAAAGNFIRSLDSVEHCGLSEISAALAGINIFDLPDIYDNMKLKEMIDRMHFVNDDGAVSNAFVRRKG